MKLPLSYAGHRVRAVAANTANLLVPLVSVRHRRRLRSPSDLVQRVARPTKAHAIPHVPTGSNIATGKITGSRNDSMPIAGTACGAV